MSIWLQKSVSIQTRTSLLKFEDHRFCRSRFRSHAEPLVVHQQSQFLELCNLICGSLSNSTILKSYDRNKLQRHFGTGNGAGGTAAAYVATNYIRQLDDLYSPNFVTRTSIYRSQTSNGPFSAVSTPILAIKFSLECS